MLAAYDGNIRKLFNTSGQVYRQENLSKRLPDLTNDDALAMLATNGKLVKRPFLVIDGSPRMVGFNSADWETLTTPA